MRPLFLERDEALELVQRISRSDYPERQRRIDDEGLKLLGLLRPSADLGAAIDSVDEEQVLGFYDDRSRRLVVIREPGATRPLLEVTLAHELVHALEDQRFGLDSGEGLPDDSVLAEAALAEGTATALMVDYADRYLSLGDVLGLANLPEQRHAAAVPGEAAALPVSGGREVRHRVPRGERGVAADRLDLPLPAPAVGGADPAPAPVCAGRAPRARAGALARRGRSAPTGGG